MSEDSYPAPPTEIETTPAYAGPSYGSSGQAEGAPDFFVVDDLFCNGFSNYINVFGSSLVTGSEFQLSSIVLKSNLFTAREISQERLGSTLEELSLQGKNCIYIAGAQADLWDDFFEAIDDRSQAVVYGAYSYNLTAPIIEVRLHTHEGTHTGLKCNYDGSEISTYDAKFGAINISASADTILADYINSIAQDVVVSELFPLLNNKTVPVRNILTPSANMPAQTFLGSSRMSQTGSSDSILINMGGSSAPSSGGGGY